MVVPCASVESYSCGYQRFCETCDENQYWEGKLGGGGSRDSDGGRYGGKRLSRVERIFAISAVGRDLKNGGIKVWDGVNRKGRGGGEEIDCCWAKMMRKM